MALQAVCWERPLLAVNEQDVVTSGHFSLVSSLLFGLAPWDGRSSTSEATHSRTHGDPYCSVWSLLIPNCFLLPVELPAAMPLSSRSAHFSDCAHFICSSPGGRLAQGPRETCDELLSLFSSFQLERGDFLSEEWRERIANTRYGGFGSNHSTL